MKVNILDITVSKITSYNDPFFQPVNLLDYLKDDSLKNKVEDIRAIGDEDTQKSLKAKLPAIAVSGLFDKRSAEGLIKHSGLIAFDIDAVQDMEQTFTALKKIPYVVYCAKSVRGKGYWGIFWISNPKKHKEHFDAMDAFFRSKNIAIDKVPSSVASLRGYSHDDRAYFNFNALQFTYIIYNRTKPKTPSFSRPGLNRFLNPIKDYNQNGNIHELLIKKGWTWDHTKGSRIRYSRPGKGSGTSADYHTELKVFYVFSSDAATELESSKKSYSHAQLFCRWECGGDIKLCFKKLRDMGYGKL